MLPLPAGRMAPHSTRGFCNAQVCNRIHRYMPQMPCRNIKTGPLQLKFQSDIAACWLPEGPGLVTVSWGGVSGCCSAGCSKNCAARRGRRTFTKKRLGAGGVTSFRNPWRSAAGRVVRFRGWEAHGGPMRTFEADGGCDDQRRHRSQRRLQFGARPTQYEDHAL